MLRDYIFKENNIKEFFLSLKSEIENSRRIVCFGAGMGAVNTLEWIKKEIPNSMESICYLLDNNPLKWNTELEGVWGRKIKVLRPNKENLSDVDLLIITCGEGDVILEQLEKIGLDRATQILVPDISAIDRTGGDFTFIWSHMDELNSVYSLLNDEKSKLVFRNILNFKICHSFELIEEISDSFERQYFDESLIRYEESDVFVDCGSFIGDTIEYYKKWSRDCFKRVYAIETDDRNFKLLEAKFSSDKRIIPMNIGVWNEEKELLFNNVGSGSGTISNDGNVVIRTNTVDNIVKGEKVDFIKMDIEGAEYNALLGCINTIIRYKPTLMISIYHKQDDFIRIPLLIKSMYPDYRLYIRHYRKMSVQETVCYAIASE